MSGYKLDCIKLLNSLEDAHVAVLLNQQCRDTHLILHQTKLRYIFWEHQQTAGNQIAVTRKRQATCTNL